MAKKKDLDFDDEEEEGEGDEYAQDDQGDLDEDYDEDEEEEESGPGGGSRVVRLALLVVVFLGAVGAGAFVLMSSGGKIPFLFDLFAKQPTPAPFVLPSGFANRNLETRKPAMNAALTREATGLRPEGSYPGTVTAARPSGGAPGGAAKGAANAPPMSPKSAVLATRPKDVTTQPDARVGSALRPGVKALADTVKPVAKSAILVATMAGVRNETPDAASRSDSKVVMNQKQKMRDKRRWQDRQVRRAERRRGSRWTSLAAGQRGRGGFSVQVGAFSEPTNAQRLIASLRSQGFQAFGSGRKLTGGLFHVRSNVVDSRGKVQQLANQFRLAGRSPRVQSISSGRYMLHLGTYSSQEEASRQVGDLNTKGLFATVSGRVGMQVPADGPNRVWVGSYSNRAEAEAVASRLRTAVGAAIVVRR